MNPDKIREIDESLAALGWRYNAEAERFETAPQRDGDWAYVDWEDVLAALPHLSLNDLIAYDAARQGR